MASDQADPSQVSDSSAPETAASPSQRDETPAPETVSPDSAASESASAAPESSGGPAQGESSEGKPRIKIGTQRPGSSHMKPKPPPVKKGRDVKTPEDQPRQGPKIPTPSVRKPLDDELEAEVREMEQAMADLSMDQLAPGGEPVEEGEEALSGRHSAKVLALSREDVFVELGPRQQGVLSLGQFGEEPQVGQTIEVVVNRFDREEGLYHVGLPGAAVAVADWSELSEGAVVEVQVTGHNKGGLEVEVSNIRGFIPASQIEIFRVEDFSDYVGQKLTCVATEVNQEKRNLVLSRRAVLEREMAQQREETFGSLEVGQIREGIVRSLMDFGAFVELGGGIDGLVHISKLSWSRVKHPGDVLKEGERVKVKIDRIDPETRKIGLSIRDLLPNPWDQVVENYPPKSRATGPVTKVMDFGAFVEIEPGVEGLVHVSEISHQRVFRVSDFLKEGQQVEVEIQAIDRDKQRISLSMKALEAKMPAKSEKPEEPEEDEPRPELPKPKGPLKGGLGRGSGGDQFGLNL